MRVFAQAESVVVSIFPGYDRPTLQKIAQAQARSVEEAAAAEAAAAEAAEAAAAEAAEAGRPAAGKEASAAAAAYEQSAAGLMLQSRECKHGQMIYPLDDEFVGRSLHVLGEWSEGEVQMLAMLLRPGDTVVDVGANIGALAIPFARMVAGRRRKKKKGSKSSSKSSSKSNSKSSGKVYAFEPQRRVFNLLSANAAINGHDRTLSAERAAVGAVAGWLKMPAPAPSASPTPLRATAGAGMGSSFTNYGGFSLPATADEGEDRNSGTDGRTDGRTDDDTMDPDDDADYVRVVTLDEEFLGHGPGQGRGRRTRVKLIKVDVEGMESKVLQGAHRLLTGRYEEKDAAGGGGAGGRAGERAGGRAGRAFLRRPLVFIENDRVDGSEALIQQLLDLNFTLYWHFTPLYTHDNYRGYDAAGGHGTRDAAGSAGRKSGGAEGGRSSLENELFGPLLSVNMLCVPVQEGVQGEGGSRDDGGRDDGGIDDGGDDEGEIDEGGTDEGGTDGDADQAKEEEAAAAEEEQEEEEQEANRVRVVIADLLRRKELHPVALGDPHPLQGLRRQRAIDWLTTGLPQCESASSSQNGEDGIIQALVGYIRQLGNTAGGGAERSAGRDMFVEVGSSDGKGECNSRRLREAGWKGVLFDSLPTEVNGQIGLNRQHAWVTAENVGGLLAGQGVPHLMSESTASSGYGGHRGDGGDNNTGGSRGGGDDASCESNSTGARGRRWTGHGDGGSLPFFDLLSVDLDFNDFWVLRALLTGKHPKQNRPHGDGKRSGSGNHSGEGGGGGAGGGAGGGGDDAAGDGGDRRYRFFPRVVVVEINSHIPGDQAITVPYNASAQWDGSQYFGMSVGALHRLAASANYTMVYCESHGVNCFLVHNAALGIGSTWDRQSSKADSSAGKQHASVHGHQAQKLALEMPLHTAEELSAVRLHRPPNYFGRGGAIRYREDPLKRKWVEVL
jgi:FkbM family methyltransferase